MGVKRDSNAVTFFLSFNNTKLLTVLVNKENTLTLCLTTEGMTKCDFNWTLEKLLNHPIVH